MRETINSSLIGKPGPDQDPVAQPTTDTYTASLIALRYINFNMLEEDPPMNILDKNSRRHSLVNVLLNTYLMDTYSKKYYQHLIELIQRCHKRIVTKGKVCTLNQIIEIHFLLSFYHSSMMFIIGLERNPHLLFEEESGFRDYCD